VQGLSLKPKIRITVFIKSKMMPENFGTDANDFIVFASISNQGSKVSIVDIS